MGIWSNSIKAIVVAEEECKYQFIVQIAGKLDKELSILEFNKWSSVY